MSLRSRIVDFFYTAAPQPTAEVEDQADAPPAAAGPAEVEKAKTSPTKTTGAPGYAAFGGQLASNERNPEMVGQARWKNFDEWKRTIAPVGAALRSYLVLVGSPTWDADPYIAPDAEEPTEEDIKRAKQVARELHRMETPWRTVVQIASLAMFDGAAFQEWALKRLPDGTFGLGDVESRPMHTIERWMGIEEEGRVTGIVQRSPQTQAEIEIPLSRLVWSRDLPITDSPEGTGVMRHLAETIRELQALRRLRNKGYEKDLNGLTVAYAPIEEARDKIGQPKENGQPYTEEDFRKSTAALADLITAQVRKDAGVILDSKPYMDVDGKPSAVPRYKVDVQSVQATSHAELNAALRTCAYEILMLIGFEHLVIGADGAGSLALHGSKIAGTLRIVTSVLNGIAETMQRQLLRPRYIANGWDPDTVPTLTWDALEFKDLEKVVQSIASLLTGAAIDPGRADPAVEKILANLGLPPLKPRDDEDLVLRRREEAAAAAGIKKPKADQDPDDVDLEDDEDEE